MKPLRMELEGFARFRERQVISFEDLSLFAISGPTGAGKTLVLDALSFALYGVTPRLSQKLDGLISSGKDRLHVDLQFEAGSGIYRVVRSMERKKSGTVSKATRIERLEDARWLRIPETEKLTEADAKLEQIIGLDFRAFTRSILLPQGKFDEFLHGEPRQRRNLLKELLDLGRVDTMREEAGRREREVADGIERINGRLASEGLDEAPGKLRELKKSLSQLLADEERDREQLAATRGQLADQTALGSLHDELEALAVRLDEQRKAAADTQGLRSELELGRLAAGLEPMLVQVEELEREVTDAGQELVRLQAGLKQAEQEFGAATARAEQATEQLDKSEPELREQLEEISKILPLARRLERLGGAPAKPAKAAAGDWNEARLDELQELSARLPGLLSAAKRQEETGSAAEELSADLSRLKEERERLSSELATVTSRGKAEAERIRELEARHEELLKQAGDAAAALREGLVQGAACPVCGQPVQELPEHDHGQLTELNSQIEQAQGLREKLREQYSSLDSQLSGLTARSEAGERALTAARTGSEAALKELTGSLVRFREAGFQQDPDLLEAAVSGELAQQLAALAATVAVHGADPLLAADELRQKLRELTSAEREASRTLQEAERALLTARGQAETRQALAERVQADLKRQSGEAARRLEDAGFADRAAVRAAGRSENRLLEIEELLRKLEQEFGRLNSRESELKELIAGRPDPRGELEALTARFAQLEANMLEFSEQRGSLQAAVELQEERSRQRLELMEERRKLEDDREVWRLLALDLRDDRFTDFLLADMQRRLASRASHIIRQVTADRFDLHLSETREFEVSDAWAGGERRSARNLSGGETFIVSLALALALSDSAAGGRRLGALFLDEGFGTLDVQTLDSVAEVLESLSTDGRLVGLITHVPELSERMPARLLVSKEAEGSTLYWED